MPLFTEVQRLKILKYWSKLILVKKRRKLKPSNCRNLGIITQIKTSKSMIDLEIKGNIKTSYKVSVFHIQIHTTSFNREKYLKLLR